jgi:adenine-specific DNA methylase
MEKGGFMRRLIEEDFPIFEVSKESAREKSIRHGHISTIHIWWARRPLAACRAAIFASLVPDPATMTAPDPVKEYADFLMDILPQAPNERESEYLGMRARKRLLKFVADLSPWEASSNQQLLKKARKIIEVGTAVINGLRKKELAEVIEGKRKVEMPKVLDPFAGGGSIPLEALRLGCEAHAVEYNPVAVLILKATLEWPQKYGEKLIKDVEKWGNWVLEEAGKEIGKFYPEQAETKQKSLVEGGKKDGWIPVGYIWARTMQCQRADCGAEIPLMRQFWLRRKEDSTGKVEWRNSVYLHPLLDKKRRRVEFEMVEGKRIEGFDPSKGSRPTTLAKGAFECPICGTSYKSPDLRKYGKAKGFGQRMICVILHNNRATGKQYRVGTEADLAAYSASASALQDRVASSEGEYSAVPDEPLPPDGTLGFRVNKYGLKTWGDLFNSRQLLCLQTFAAKVGAAYDSMNEEGYDIEYATAIATYLAFCVDRIADYNSSLAIWAVSGEFVAHTFGRQALPMVWDYFELNPFAEATGDWRGAQHWVMRAIEHCRTIPSVVLVSQGSATVLRYEQDHFAAVVTDPPYYDNVPYSDLSDFFYVWLKRSVGNLHHALFATPLTPKSEEIIQEPERHGKNNDAAKRFYQNMMGNALAETYRALSNTGLVTIVFAHKTTAAWEALINALIDTRLVPVSSWPVHTERPGRLRSIESAALASSFFLSCRRRQGVQTAYFKDIKHELEKRIMERLDHFWEQGIRGADFFISAIGPAVEVFGRYEKVKKISGEEVSVAELLDEVRKQVTSYALRKILHGLSLEKIDPLSRFYLLWRWTYNGETVAYDDARKLSQAVGIELDEIRGKEKLVSGKDEITVAKPDDRKLDEIARKQPVSLIDALHKACLLWKADRRKELEAFLADVGVANDPTFWETAQALSELLPDGDREKQMIQGLLMKAPTIVKEKEGVKQLTLDEGWKL